VLELHDANTITDDVLYRVIRDIDLAEIQMEA